MILSPAGRARADTIPVQKAASAKMEPMFFMVSYRALINVELLQGETKNADEEHSYFLSAYNNLTRQTPNLLTSIKQNDKE
jgi:hypothetical protein